MTKKYFGNELKYIEQVLNSDKWSSTEGDWVYRLEQNFAMDFNSKYAIAMNSGTSTLHAALFALGVGPGDEVIIPALSVIMDTAAVIHNNSIPVYADILTKDFTIDPVDVEKKITSKTKAIIAVSLYGHDCDMDRLLEISRNYNIPIIEDNAQHLSSHRAHFTSYSFEGSKFLSCSEGGILLTSNKEWARRARLLANHGFINNKPDSGRTKLNLDVFQDPIYKRHCEIGWNYRMSEFQAAVALAQTEKILEIIKKRKKYAKMFYDVLTQEGKTFFMTPEFNDKKNTYWTFATRFISHEFNKRKVWKEFRKRYVENGGDGIYSSWQVSYLEPVMLGNKFKQRAPQIYENVKYKKGICPIAENIQPQLMQFKLNYTDDKVVEQKVEALKKTIEEERKKYV